MIHTSYYGNIKNFPENSYLIGISRTIPAGIKCDKHLSVLSPSPYTLKSYKEGTIGEEEYTAEYIHGLNTINEGSLLKFLQDKEAEYPGGVFLLCYERPEQFCHRHILADYLNIGITEYPIYKGSEINGQIGPIQ